MRPFLFFVLFPFLFKAQDSDILKIKKQNEAAFLFFQIGQPNDTISDNENDLFYLKVAGKKRCTTRIEIENGKLEKFMSDTIYKLVFYNNLDYLHFYEDTIPPDDKHKKHVISSGKKSFEKCLLFKTAIDGANLNKSKIITVKFLNSENGSVYVTNKFFYK
jgi:hypothetical protein